MNSITIIAEKHKAKPILVQQHEYNLLAQAGSSIHLYPALYESGALPLTHGLVFTQLAFLIDKNKSKSINPRRKIGIDTLATGHFTWISKLYLGNVIKDLEKDAKLIEVSRKNGCMHQYSLTKSGKKLYHDKCLVEGERFIQVYSALVDKLSLPEAIVIGRIHNASFKKESFTASHKYMQEKFFPFYCDKTVRTAIKSLIDRKLVCSYSDIENMDAEDAGNKVLTYELNYQNIQKLFPHFYEVIHDNATLDMVYAVKKY
jgi:hypothetical protein